MNQKQLVTISSIAVEYINKMQKSLGFFSSDDDRKIVQELRSFLAKKPTDDAIISKFNNIATIASNIKFKGLHQQFIAQINYRYNSEIPAHFWFSIPDIANLILSFIPNLKFFYNATNWVFNFLELKNISLVCKAFYFSVRNFYKAITTISGSPYDSKIKVISLKNEAVKKIKRVANKKELATVVTEIDPQCGYFELKLTESQLADFKSGKMKIKLENCERAYFLMEFESNSTSSVDCFLYCYIDQTRFVEINRNFKNGGENYFYTRVYQEKKEITDRYNKSLTKISVGEKLIIVNAMLLNFKEWEFFIDNSGFYDVLNYKREAQFKLTVIDNQGKTLFPQYKQMVDINNIYLCSAFLNFDAKKLYSLYLIRSLYFNRPGTFYLNEWDDLNRDKLKVHELDLSKLLIDSVKVSDYYFLDGREAEASFHMVNSRYLFLKISRSVRLKGEIYPGIIIGIIIYDLQKDLRVYEHYFRPNLPYGSPGAQYDFLTCLGGERLEISVLFESHIQIQEQGSSEVIIINLSLPFSEKPSIESPKEVSKAVPISPWVIGFFVGLVFSLVSLLITLAILSVALVLAALIASSAWVVGFLVGYITSAALTTASIEEDIKAYPAIDELPSDARRDEGNQFTQVMPSFKLGASMDYSKQDNLDAVVTNTRLLTD